MQLARLVKGLASATILALIYVHMQMNIFCLAYEGRQKEQHVVRLREQNGRVSSGIVELQSADSMGRKMLARDARLKFYDETSVVRIASARPQADDVRLAGRPAERSGPLARLLTAWHFPSEAQAKDRSEFQPWQRRR